MRRALVLLGLLSCKVANEQYCDPMTVCPGHLTCDFSRNLCVDGDAPGPDAPRCTDGSCPGTLVCLDGTCVQCVDPDRDCDRATPICEDHVCRKCTGDAECGGVCDTEAGTCVPGAEILYVTNRGGGTSCTAGVPCAKISDAVAQITAGKHWILVGEGTYADTVAINTPEAVNIVGVGALLVRIIPSTTSGAAISVGSSANVLVRDLRVANGTDPKNDGIRCNGDAGTRLRVSRVDIENNGGAGIDSSRCNLTVERSRIFKNTGGGIVLFQSGFTIRNNYIYSNGSGISDTGGVRAFTVESPAVFAFNTVTKNTAMPGVGPGLHCDAAASMNSVIVWGNGASADVAQVGGSCSFDYSDIGGTAVPTQHNIKLDPGFVNPGADDYALGPTSPCADKGKPDPETVVDFQGEPRPKPGTAPDIGADERY